EEADGHLFRNGSGGQGIGPRHVNQSVLLIPYLIGAFHIRDGCARIIGTDDVYVGQGRKEDTLTYVGSAHQEYFILFRGHPGVLGNKMTFHYSVSSLTRICEARSLPRAISLVARLTRTGPPH